MAHGKSCTLAETNEGLRLILRRFKVNDWAGALTGTAGLIGGTPSKFHWNTIQFP